MVRARRAPGRSRVVMVATLICALIGAALSGTPQAPAGADEVLVTFEGTLYEPYTTAEDARVPLERGWVQLLVPSDFSEGWRNYSLNGFSAQYYVEPTDDGSFSLSVRAADLATVTSWALHVAPSPERADPETNGDEPLGSAIIPFTADQPVDGKVTLGDITVPVPDLVGRLLDRPSADPGGPVENIFVRIAPRDAIGNEGPGTQSMWTSSTGAFAFKIPDGQVALAELVVESDPADRQRVRFRVPVAGLVGSESVTVQYPEPNVTGTLTGAGEPVADANLRLELFEPDEEGENGYWAWIDASTTTDEQGRYWLAVAFEAGRSYRLSVDTRVVDGVILPAFTQSVAGPGNYDLVYPRANLTGTLYDVADESAREGVPWASLTLREMVTEDGYTWYRWLSVNSSTVDGGFFAMFLDDALLAAVLERPSAYDLQIYPPYGQLLPVFSVSLSDVVGGSPGPADLLGVELTFPTANVSGTVRQGDAPVRDANVVAQREVTEFGITRWEWTEHQGSTDELGRFVLYVPGLETGEWRLRVRLPGDQSALRFVVPITAGSATGLDITVPEPDLTGTVLADLGDGEVPVPGAIVQVQRYSSSFDWWEWTELYVTTDSDGRFAIVLDDPAAKLQLRISPPSGLTGVFGDFTFSLEGLTGEGLLDLRVVAPRANVTGVVLLPDGSAPVRSAYVNVERLVVESGFSYWAWVSEGASTGADGRFAITVPDELVDPQESYRLRVSPPWNRGAELSGFVFDIPGPGLATDLELRFPVPNVAGVVRDPSGVGVRYAWLSVDRWNDEFGYWEGLVYGSTSSDGSFALFTDQPGPHRLVVYSPWNRGDLANFEVAIDLAAPGTTALELAFPTPNLSTVLVDGAGDPVRFAHAWVERRMPPGEEDLGGGWTGIYGSSDSIGRMALNVTEAGEYRLHVSPPYGRDLPGFTVDFGVTGGGVLTGVPAELVFPSPNLRIRVEDGTGAPIRFSFLEVRRLDEATGTYQYTDTYAATNGEGRASLLLSPGSYRVYAHPPWFSSELAYSYLDVEIGEGGETLAETVVLRAPNVRGTVQLDSTRSARWAWVEVVTDGGSGEQLPGTHVRGDGTFALGLADGEYLLRVWSSDPLASSGPLEAVVTVAGGAVSSWRYAIQSPGTDNCGDGTCVIGMSFDDEAVRPNLVGTLTNGSSAVSGAFVVAEATAAGSGGTPAGWTATAVTGTTGTFALLVPSDITVTLRIIVTDGDAPVTVELPGTFAAGDTIASFDIAALLAQAEG